MRQALLVALPTLLVVAVLTAGAISVRSVSRIWLRHWVERRLAGATLAELYLEHPQRLIVSAGTGIALAVFMAGATVEALDGSWLQLALRLLVVAVLVLVVGQVVPRAIARRWPVRAVPVLVPVLRVTDVIVAAPRAIGAGIARLVTGRGAPLPEAEEARDSIEDLLREGQLEGVGETEELAIITGVVQFGEKTAGEVMTPREQVFALDVALPPRELALRVARSAYSRVPVHGGSLDDVRGIVTAFDVLRSEGEAMPPLHPVHVAAPGAPCNELLFAMLRARRHLAVVRGEDGRTLGIVTLEDLLEELVGDIRDEHDEPAAASTDGVRPASIRTEPRPPLPPRPSAPRPEGPRP